MAMASRETIVVAPLTTGLRGQWGSVQIERNGEVRAIREFGSPQLAYADARQEWRPHVDFVVSHRALSEVAAEPDTAPVDLGRGYILRCQVGLSWENGMWCAARFSPDGELVEYRKVGASPFYDLGAQTYAELNLNRSFIPDEMEVRHDILAVEFVPQVKRDLEAAEEAKGESSGYTARKRVGASNGADA